MNSLAYNNIPEVIKRLNFQNFLSFSLSPFISFPLQFPFTFPFSILGFGTLYCGCFEYASSFLFDDMSLRIYQCLFFLSLFIVDVCFRIIVWHFASNMFTVQLREIGTELLLASDVRWGNGDYIFNLVRQVKALLFLLPPPRFTLLCYRYIFFKVSIYT